VGDNPQAVGQNWQLLSKRLGLPSSPQLLNQTHGTAMAGALCDGSILTADGSYTRTPGRVCTVMTADCLPILLCNTSGTEVAAIHAGWRGLAAGIVCNAIRQLSSSSSTLIAYLGPTISQQHFEVGDEVRQAFLDNTFNHKTKSGDSRNRIEACFSKSSDRQKKQDEFWMADLYGLAAVALNAEGITQIYGGNFCTYTDSKQFYSYRREGQTGRMASLIWIR
jgi:YfiH family protein